MNNFDRLGIMLDCSRNSVKTVDTLKRFISYISKMGYNTLMLYMEDVYELDGEPYFGYRRGRYTKKEMQEVDAYAKENGVELCPCIQTLAHLNIFKTRHFNSVLDYGDILLVGSEETYALIEKMFKACSEMFTSRNINIGMDEAHMLGFGRYRQINGKVEPQPDIFCKHLKRVLEIADKYGFKCQMWSDMFYRMGCGGAYYEKLNLTQDILDRIPKNVEIVYWDYYHKDKKTYDMMWEGHKKLGTPLGFAGGIWTWAGAVPFNEYSELVSTPAIKSCISNGIRNAIFTMWGDNGGECSPFALLPAIMKVAYLAQGKTDKEEMKVRFKEITGEDFDDMMKLDLPNQVGTNSKKRREKGSLVSQCPSKYLLYNDPLICRLDSTLIGTENEDYKKIAKILRRLANKNTPLSYLYKTEASLSEALSVKAELGNKTREAYLKGDKEELKRLISIDYPKAIKLITKLYNDYDYQWHYDNKPEGFEVQDMRYGTLTFRLKAAIKRIQAYLNGEVKNIPEYEETLLDYEGNGYELSKKAVPCNYWNDASTLCDFH